jgi:hypothetical protein
LTGTSATGARRGSSSSASTTAQVLAVAGTVSTYIFIYVRAIGLTSCFVHRAVPMRRDALRRRLLATHRRGDRANRCRVRVRHGGIGRCKEKRGGSRRWHEAAAPSHAERARRQVRKGSSRFGHFHCFTESHSDARQAPARVRLRRAPTVHHIAAAAQTGRAQVRDAVRRGGQRDAVSSS